MAKTLDQILAEEKPDVVAKARDKLEIFPLRTSVKPIQEPP